MSSAFAVLASLRARLTTAGVPEPGTTAKLILASVLGKRSGGDADDAVRRHVLVPAAASAAAELALARRVRREPLQYILGTVDFDVARDLVVRAPILVPRPETEQLVSLASEHVTACAADVVLELGCGSGAIAVTLLLRHPRARVVAVDVSPAAIALTQENAARQGVHDRLFAVCADACASGSGTDAVAVALAAARGDRGAAAGAADVVVSNPPYIPDEDLAGLQPEVASWEDLQALAGGAHEGLAVPLAFLASAARRGWLRRGGAALLEVNATHPALLRAALRPVDGEHTARGDARDGGRRFNLTLPPASGFGHDVSWAPSAAERRRMDVAAAELWPTRGLELWRNGIVGAHAASGSVGSDGAPVVGNGSVAEYVADAWAWVRGWADFAGLPRFVQLQRR